MLPYFWLCWKRWKVANAAKIFLVLHFSDCIQKQFLFLFFLMWNTELELISVSHHTLVDLMNKTNIDAISYFLFKSFSRTKVLLFCNKILFFLCFFASWAKIFKFQLSYVSCTFLEQRNYEYVQLLLKILSLIHADSWKIRFVQKIRSDSFGRFIHSKKVFGFIRLDSRLPRFSIREIHDCRDSSASVVENLRIKAIWPCTFHVNPTNIRS